MKLKTIARYSTLSCVVALLAACGGGDDSAYPVITLQGTAATGAAISGGTVNVTCKVGTGTATSAANGSYTIKVVGSGPCLISVTTGGATLYSVASGTGTTLNANVTPMTNLLVNYLQNVPGTKVSGTTPEAWFAGAGARTLLSDTTALNTRVVSDFLPALKTLAPLITLTDSAFLSTPFTPLASPLDTALETLKATTGVLNSNGTASTASATTLTTLAADDKPVVVPTGATGAGG